MPGEFQARSSCTHCWQVDSGTSHRKLVLLECAEMVYAGVLHCSCLLQPAVGFEVKHVCRGCTNYTLLLHSSYVWKAFVLEEILIIISFEIWLFQSLHWVHKLIAGCFKQVNKCFLNPFTIISLRCQLVSYTWYYFFQHFQHYLFLFLSPPSLRLYLVFNILEFLLDLFGKKILSLHTLYLSLL